MAQAFAVAGMAIGWLYLWWRYLVAVNRIRGPMGIVIYWLGVLLFFSGYMGFLGCLLYMGCVIYCSVRLTGLEGLYTTPRWPRQLYGRRRRKPRRFDPPMDWTRGPFSW